VGPGCMVAAPVGVQCVDCVRRSQPRATARSMSTLGRSASVTSVLIAVNVIIWLVGVVLVPGVGLISGSPLAGIAGLSARAVAAGGWWRGVPARLPPRRVPLPR